MKNWYMAGLFLFGVVVGWSARPRVEQTTTEVIERVVEGDSRQQVDEERDRRVRVQHALRKTLDEKHELEKANAELKAEGKRQTDRLEFEKRLHREFERRQSP
jgi:hypothetical protein